MNQDEHQRERMRAWVRAAIRDTRLRADIPATELAALREKARLWDAVASGKVQLEMYPSGTACVSWEHGDRTYPTAAEAVEAAIAAGALK